MRTLSLVFAVALVVACEKAPVVTPTAPVERDPIKSFEELVTRFPKRSIMKISGIPYDIVNVTFDVKKTDSLMNPVIGIINFNADATITDLRLIAVFLNSTALLHKSLRTPHLIGGSKRTWGIGHQRFLRALRRTAQCD